MKVEEAVTPAPVTRRQRGARWVFARALGVAAAFFAAAVVTAFMVDLGPVTKERAEREATNYLKRPMHIGKLSARLRPGSFVLENVTIEGLTPDARPFLVADRITVQLPWWTV